MSRGVRFALAALCICSATSVWAQEPPKLSEFDTKVGIDQKIGQYIPKDAVFTDEYGKQVQLGDYLGGPPVVLNLIFYNCAGVCTLELNGMIKVLSHLPMVAGREFRIVTVSIHPKERSALAKTKKDSLIDLYRPEAAAGWSLLTGTQDQITRIAQSVGFRYTYDPVTDRIQHAACLIFLTPQGQISRYLFGVKYSEKEFIRSVELASQNKLAKADPKPVLYGCFVYDPATGKYTLQVLGLLKVAGVITVFLMAVFITYLSLTGTKRRQVAAS